MAGKRIPFKVASALINELGERLVGQPHIALAELVKNAYDADASKVIIRVEEDRIEVIDNGHGMTEEEIANFWMRIGTPHKQDEHFSRKLRRPLTGSKGIGRLSMQFLAPEVELRTVPEKSPTTEFKVHVDWRDVITKADVTEAYALQQAISPPKTEFPEGRRHGTALILNHPKHEWGEKQIEQLAKEIWVLQPPFSPNPSLERNEQKTFSVELQSSSLAHEAAFESQMTALLDIWEAKLSGRINSKREVELLLEFSDGTRTSTRYEVPTPHLHDTRFEIRLFDLRYRQPRGIQVEEAREYLKVFGGVHIYDAGFHLPYYGRGFDWLDIELDHSHRLSRSNLLPEALQVRDGMRDLPTQSRIFGIVHVDTGREAAKEKAPQKDLKNNAPKHLSIQPSRDRLVDNEAYQSLRHIVRWSLDFYAMETRKRRLTKAEAKRPTEPAKAKLERLENVLAENAAELPPDTRNVIVSAVKDALSASTVESEITRQHMGLLGSLATAGMAALAYEHEVAKQYHALEGMARSLESIKVRDERMKHELHQLAEQLRGWLERAQATRRLFSPLMEREDRERVERYRTKPVIDQVIQQTSFLLRGVEVDTHSIPIDLRLPKGTLAQWSAIFQNVFVNAINAMLDSPTRFISIRAHSQGASRSVLVQDTGTGVDLRSANELFKPFERKTKISRERSALGLGGLGLGLTIVRMLAENLECQVRFTVPDPGFSTAFELSWNENNDPRK